MDGNQDRPVCKCFYLTETFNYGKSCLVRVTLTRIRDQSQTRFSVTLSEDFGSVLSFFKCLTPSCLDLYILVWKGYSQLNIR